MCMFRKYFACFMRPIICNIKNPHFEDFFVQILYLNVTNITNTLHFQIKPIQKFKNMF